MADKNEYVSARTRSKARLETNKAIMSKAHEEGGDMTSSERLASAFLLLGIGNSISDDEAEIEPIIEPTTVECENESEPLTYKAALQSPQARQWKEAMRQEWQALVENHTFDIMEKGTTIHTPMTDSTQVTHLVLLLQQLLDPMSPSFCTVVRNEQIVHV